VIDEHAATELRLFINNDGSLYERLKAPIWRRMTSFKEKGTYDHQRAVAAFKYLVEAGAKQYVREFGTPSTLPWNRMFAVPTRDLVAKELAREFEAEWDVTHARPKSPAEVERDVDASISPRKWSPSPVSRGDTIIRHGREVPAPPLWRGRVNPAPAGFGPGIAYDSPQAYDEVAQSAIAFADHEVGGIGDEAEFDEGLTGYLVRRSLHPSQVRSEVDAALATRRRGR